MDIKRKGAAIMREQKIKAVLDKELMQLLENLEMSDQFNSHQCKCSFCDEIVNDNNLSAIFPHEKQVCFCCTKQVCIDRLIKLGEE